MKKLLCLAAIGLFSNACFASDNQCNLQSAVNINPFQDVAVVYQANLNGNKSDSIIVPQAQTRSFTACGPNLPSGSTFTITYCPSIDLQGNKCIKGTGKELTCFTNQHISLRNSSTNSSDVTAVCA